MIDIGSGDAPVKKTIAQRIVTGAVKVALYPVILVMTWMWRKKR